MSIRQRMYPTDEQALVMVEWCHQARFIYNTLTAELRQYLSLKESGGAWVWEKHRGGLIARLRSRLEWLGAGPSIVHQGAMRDFEQAVKRWNAGTASRPDFHRRDPRSGGFVIRDLTVKKLNRGWATVSVPKLGAVRFRLSKSFDEIAQATSARVRHQNGQWHVTFVTPPPQKIASGSGRAVGIDRGVKITVATSDDDMLVKPSLSESQQSRYLRLARAKSRTQKGSKNRRRILDQMARLRIRQANLDTDFVEQTTTRLAREYDLVVMEDLKTTQMTKRPAPKPDAASPGEYLPNGAAAKAALNRLILGSQWGRIQSRLNDKTALITVDPRNTSRRCSHCEHVAKENRESQAEFRCVMCGFECNADLNAARNILALAVGRKPEPEDIGRLRATVLAQGHEPTGCKPPTMMVSEPRAAGIPRL